MSLVPGNPIVAKAIVIVCDKPLTDPEIDIFVADQIESGNICNSSKDLRALCLAGLTGWSDDPDILTNERRFPSTRTCPDVKPYLIY
jgi:hypothetical protein